jgi:MFS family permease
MYNIENFLDSINVSVYYLSENNSNFDHFDQYVVVCAFTIIIIMCAHERMPMSQSQIKKYFQLFLVVLAAGSIYPLIFLKQGYQESMLQVFNMTLPQLNTMYSVIGLVFVFGYAPSGYLSDVFSAKKLLAVSLFFTGLGGIWFAQIPSYEYVVIIFGLWGFFSVFTFWSAHMKIVRLLGNDNEQGKFFGILDGGRGLVEAILASLALFIFSGILGNSVEIVDKREALVAVIYMYSAMLILVSVLVMIFVQDDKKIIKANAIDDKANKFQWSYVRMLFKNKYVYLHGAIIFMGYIVFWTVYYIGGFLESNVGLSSVTVASIMVVVLWMRPIGGFLGGLLADKFGRTNVQIVALLIASSCLILAAILPVGLGQTVFFPLVVILAIFFYTIRGTYWSLLGDYKLEAFILGTAIGVVSFIGYLPDVLIPIANTALWNTFGPQGGYNAYFIVSGLSGFVGVVLVVIFAKMIKNKK